MGGSLLQVKNRAYFFDHTSIDRTEYSSRRRAMYLPIVRNNVYDVFQLLDFPDPAVPTGDRPTTTVAPQALFMLNSDFVMQAARDLAARLALEAGDDRQRLARLYMIAYRRDASDEELQSNLAFLHQLEQALRQSRPRENSTTPSAWDVLCQVMLAANEFVYVR